MGQLAIREGSYVVSVTRVTGKYKDTIAIYSYGGKWFFQTPETVCAVSESFDAPGTPVDQAGMERVLTEILDDFIADGQITNVVRIEINSSDLKYVSEKLDGIVGDAYLYDKKGKPCP